MADLYEVLGVEPTASVEQIRKAYRSLARRFHPDMNPDQESEERFKTINDAYSVLSKPESRDLYDRFGDDALDPQFDAERARRADRPAAARGRRRGPDRRSPDDRETTKYRSSPRQRRAPPPPARGQVDLDIVLPVEIDLATSIKGGRISVDTPTGRHLEIEIPAGVDTGYRVKLTGQGRPGARGGPPGNLYYQVALKPHPFFHKEGFDLVLDLPLTIDEAIHGARIEIPTLEGWLRVKIPEASCGGERLRLRDRGVFGPDGRRGDLLVHLCVRLPRRIDSLGRALDRINGLYRESVREGLHF